ELRHDVALADGLAPRVLRDLAGQEEQAPAGHLVAVRVAERFHQRRRIDRLDVMAHVASSRCPCAADAESSSTGGPAGSGIGPVPSTTIVWPFVSSSSI